MRYGQRYCNRGILQICLLICLCLIIIISLILHGQLNLDQPEPIRFSKPKHSPGQCTYSTCFDVTQCAYEYPERILHKIGIFIHPPVEKWDLPCSNEFALILKTIRSSQYYVSDIRKACLFIPNIDLLNGFATDFQKSLHVLAQLFKSNNNGSNHLIFNFAWNENLHYTDMSVLASAGHSLVSYRPTFDVSLPFYNPLISKSIGQPLLGTDDRFLLTIFAESSVKSVRNLEFILASYRSAHFTNNQTIILLDDCAEFKPSNFYFTRCAQVSSSQYLPPIRQLVQYPWILSQSLFCLITKATWSNRLALYDSMASGCIPVIADDEFILPFSEILDWTRIAVRIRLDQFEMIPSILTNYSPFEIQQLHKQVNFIFKQYFSSLDKIILTTLDILNDRVYPNYAKSYAQWNNPDYVQTFLPTPPVLFYPLGVGRQFGYTALIRGQDHFGTLTKLLLQLHKAPSLRKILVVWTNSIIPAPELSLWPPLNRPLVVIPAFNNSVSGRFHPHGLIDTEAIMSLDENTCLPSALDLERAFELWCQHPDRLIKISNSQSVNNSSDPLMALHNSISFFHQHYLHLYQEFLSNAARSLVNSLDCCETYFLDWLIVQTSRQPILNIKSKLDLNHACTNFKPVGIVDDDLALGGRCRSSDLVLFTRSMKNNNYLTQILTVNIDHV